MGWPQWGSQRESQILGIESCSPPKILCLDTFLRGGKKKGFDFTILSTNSQGTVVPSFAPLDPQWNLESVDEPAKKWGQI